MAKLNDILPLMHEMETTLRTESEALQKTLTALNLKTCSFKKVLSAIERQIETAGNEFTIAFVGEFKTGKSTIINTLLGLTGESCLSSEFKADTAKCIRLMYKKESQTAESAILYKGETKEETMTWQEAKQYTSQVALDNNYRLQAKADNILEVRYYIENPLLATLNILDLPGTGSQHASTHTNLTLQKLNEADIIFWVVSTLNEPGAEAIENLEYMNQKIIPIINVWQIEKENVKGLLTPEEMEAFIINSFSAYFNGKVAPIYYYAGEIEQARDNGEEILEEWGMDKLFRCIKTMTDNQQTSEKEKRIINNLNKNINEFRSILREQAELIEERELANVDEYVKQSQMEKKALNTREQIKIKINENAAKVVRDILTVCADSADEFIEDQMRNASIKFLLKSIKRKNKEKLEEELREKFENEYLHLREPSNWFEETLNSFLEDITTVVQLEYTDFTFELWNKSITSTSVQLKPTFIKDLIVKVSDLLKKQLGKDLLTTVIGSIFFVFGGEFIGLFYMLLLDDAGVDHMEEKINWLQKRARRSILRQNSVLTNELVKLGNSINEEIYYSILTNITGEQETKEQNRIKASNSLHDMTGIIDNYEVQLRSL